MPGRPPLAWDPVREEGELREYLAEGFDLAKLHTYQETLDREYEEVGDEERFYRVSHGYLYNLTAFAMTGTKLPYLEQLMERVRPGARVLDYGCGIGSDGLMLLEAGYRVEFADFANPSTEYLRWRLARRGLEASVHDLDEAVPGGFDAAFAFDVIEHVGDPFAFLAEMERRARVVIVNFLESGEHEQDLHHDLPVGALVRRAAGRRLMLYRVLHGSSHLVIYGAQPAGPARRAAALATVAGVRARSAAGLRSRRGGRP